ncbi:hypothetical protein D3C87_266360 [compost metagenome]
MELNIEKKQQLEKLLAKPSLATQEHIPFLQQLITAFPYYQPLHLLLAKASIETENKHNALTKAALYTNGSILHSIIHDQDVDVIENINVITYEAWNNTNPVEITVNEPTTSNQETTSEAFLSTQEALVIENLEPLINEIISVETIQEEKNSPNETAIPTAQNLNNNFIVPEIENLEPLQSEIIKVCEPAQITETTSEADEQEIFEEINEFIAPPKNSLEKENEVTATNLHEEIPVVNEIEELEEEISSQNLVEETEEELVIETMAGTDFFAFDRNFSSANAAQEAEAKVSQVNIEPTISHTSVQENIVSKYDDDQLPFTFLWWLAKTRKDHEQIFRPFASPVAANAQPLQQQYVEHIFHIQAPLAPIEEELASATPLPATKENSIIEKFIKNDPQIKALKPDQINNENKAKRSAEDSNDVVSETLAQIYIEQMLYHKAIDTYQKLSLKFPEKSGYFADLIQSLEKKI